MELQSRERWILIIGLAITALLVFINIYYAVMVLILVMVLLMSYRIMGETEHLPDMVAHLQDDAKAVLLINRGNDLARQIHVTLVPLDMEFDLPLLEPEAKHTIALPSMVSEVKVVITYQNATGRNFSRTFPLSAMGENEEDLLRPAFPLFGWK
jgi:hypothetical protein